MTAGKLPLTLLLMMVIVSAGFLIQLQPASATFPGGNGKIAFVSNRDGDDEIYVMNADGSGVTRLTFDVRFSDRGADWQPLRAGPVGGVVEPVNKLALATPFLALAGLVVAVSAVVVVKRRSKD